MMMMENSKQPDNSYTSSPGNGGDDSPGNNGYSLSFFHFCPHCGSYNFIDNDFKSKRCLDCGFVFYLNASAATAAFILDGNGRLLAEHRRLAPSKGKLDLPGGFVDMGETVEKGVAREVAEETGLVVSRAEFLFSFPNKYLYSGFTVPTIDLFFLCSIDEEQSCLHAADDAADVVWLDVESVNPDDFAFDSTRKAVRKFLSNYSEYLKK